MANQTLGDMQFLEKKFNGWKQSEKAITFIGGTTNAIGDYDGTGDPFNIFTVSGTVLMKVIGIVETTLVGAATIEVGITGDTAAILAQVANASTMAIGEIWHDATVDKKIELTSVMVENIVAGSNDIIGNIGAANITAGAIRFICLWKPLSKDGHVEAA